MRFYVAGIPAPQGSKRALHHRATGKIVLLESSKRVKPWRAQVAEAAHAAWGTAAPLVGPVELHVVFYFERPKSHYPQNSRNAGGVLRPSAPMRPVGHGRNDLDKLARAVLDALTGVIYEDDAQVVSLVASKEYARSGRTPGASIEVVVA